MTPTYFALGYFYVYLDYFYPKGGTGSIPNLLEGKILDWGGEIRLNKTIVEIKPGESMLIDSDGEHYAYDHLVWAADLRSMYKMLNLDGLDSQSIQAIETKKQQVKSSKGAESVFILFMAVDRPPEYFKQNGGEHLFYTPSRAGLGETNQEERLRLIEDFQHVSKQEILQWLDRYLSLNTFEISAPALRDPSLAPAGQTGLMVSCLFDFHVIENIEKAGWYQEFKAILESRVVDVLANSIYKDLKEDILFMFSSTPLTIHKYSGSSEGAITGWSFETESPVVNELKDIPKSSTTPIPNIYQAGQWAYSPAGVPIAMLTGWYATQAIKKQSK
jgi:phytoene dehydrogenase-like protein